MFTLNVQPNTRTSEQGRCADSAGYSGRGTFLVTTFRIAAATFGGCGAGANGGGRCGDTRCERIFVTRGGTSESRHLRCGGWIGLSHGVVGVENVIDDVNDTIGDKDVRDEDSGAVDKDIAVFNGDGEFAAAKSGQGHSVHEVRAVADSAVDNWYQ